jgi:hypothetical protein
VLAERGDLLLGREAAEGVGVGAERLVVRDVEPPGRLVELEGRGQGDALRRDPC